MIRKTLLIAAILGVSIWFYMSANPADPDVASAPAATPTETSNSIASAFDELADDASQPVTNAIDPPDEARLELQPGDIIYQRGDFVERRLVVTECYPETLSAYTDEGLVTLSVPRCEKELKYLHPYGDLDRDSLATLAEYDGAAALILAEKMALEKPNDRRVTRLFIQAFALSNEQQAFEALFDYAGGHGLVYADGELDVPRAANSYVWSSIGERAGFRGTSDVSTYREALVDAGISIASLDKTVERIATLIASESTKYTGEALL